MTENPEEIIKYGLFKGFNIYVFFIILLQAITGLVRSPSPPVPLPPSLHELSET